MRINARGLTWVVRTRRGTTKRATSRPPVSINAMWENLLLVVEIRQRESFFGVVVGFGAEEVFEVGLDGDGFVLLEVDLAVDGHARSGGDEAADDDVSLEAAQVIDPAGDAGFGEHSGDLLGTTRRR